MNRERLVWSIILLTIMAVGLLIGIYTRRSSGEPQGEANPFRTWLWQNRTLDLLIQSGLILIGALGVATLLPDKEER